MTLGADKSREASEAKQLDPALHRPDSGGRLQWANALRGVAAIAVMLGHLMVAPITLQPWAEGNIGMVAGRPLGDPVGLADLSVRSGFDVMGAGVCLFFMISGLVIAKSLRLYSRTGFMVGRVVRILPTYAVGYLAILLAVGFGRLFQGQAWSLQWVDLVGMVPGLPVLLGIDSVPNAVAWTLIVEFAFYGLCLVGYRHLADSDSSRILVAVACVVAQQIALASRAALPHSLQGLTDLLLVALPFLPLLLIGMCVARAGADPRDAGVGGEFWRVLWPVPILLGATLWMTQFRVWWPFSPLGIDGAGGAYQVTMVITVACFIAVSRWRAHGFQARVWSWAADLSYPLYVVHLMVGWVAIFALIRLGWPTLAAQLLAVFVTVALAAGLHRSVEAPTHRLSRRWARGLTQRAMRT